MKTRTLYACEICEREWDDESDAALCEASPLPPRPVEPGRVVYLRNDTGPGEPRTYTLAIVDELIPSYSQSSGTPGHHCWRIMLDRRCNLDGDCYRTACEPERLLWPCEIEGWMREDRIASRDYPAIKGD